MESIKRSPLKYGMYKNMTYPPSSRFVRNLIEVDIKELIINSNFLDDIDQPIFVKDSGGIYVYCNEAFSNFVGIPAKKIISHTAFDIAPQAFAKIYTEADKELFASASDQRYLSKVKSQSETQEVKVIFKKSIIYDQSHNLSGFIGTIELHKSIVHDSIAEIHKLTEREIEVLDLLAKGKSVKQIAAILMISPYTVTDHLKSIYLKLDVHSKNEAIYKALAFWATKPG
jgi:DNA-binding CsgD family transcriptional regulator